MYLHRHHSDPVELAFTDRHGGVSAAPFDSLNLALVGDDDPVACATNLVRVLDDFSPGSRLAQMSQVHGNTVAYADPDHAPEADGLVCDQLGVALIVRVADCVPVLLADPARGVIGAAHAGRQGLLLDVVSLTVARMRRLGAEDIQAWVGPRVCGSCYEVPPDMQREVLAVVPEAEAVSAQGTPALDIGAGVIAQLRAGGVAVHDVGVCTRESADLYSYRRDGRGAGRFAGLIWIRP